MASWKKVIVSGSSANLTALQVDNLTSGQVVIGGGASNLSTTAINGTGNIVATTGATGLTATGSFTGSFRGTFTGTTDLPDLTQGTGITTFTYDGSTTATVAVSGAASLSTNNITKWTGNAFANSSLSDNGTVVSGASSIQLTGASSALTGSFTGSFKGDGSGLSGVAASFPTVATTDLATADAFYVQQSGNARYITYGNLLTDLAGTNLAVEGSDSLALATTITGITSITSTNFVGNLTGSAATASYVVLAQSASYVQNAQTASYVLNAVSASFAQTASYVANSLSASFIGNAVTNNVDNYVLTATGGGQINGESNLTFNGSLLTVTGNAVVTGDLTVQGTTTTINTDNLLVEDKFALFASGSTTGTDGGIVVQASTGAGTATGFAYGYKTTEDRWAFQDALAFNATSFGTVTAWSTTTQYGLASAKPNDATGPAYGGATYGYGNIWVSTDTAEIWIYA